LHALSAASLLALISFGALAHSRHVDSEPADAYDHALRSWLALEFRLSAEVLKARAGVVAHYDAIVQTEAARKRVLTTLQRLPGFLGHDAALQASLREAERERDAADHLLEQFKREHSVLRNSLQFLPLLAAELAAQPAQPAARGDWHWIALAVVQDALLLQHRQEPAIAQRLDDELARLERARGQLGSSEPQGLEALLLHGRIVRERTPKVDQLSARILAGPAAARAQEITASYAARLRSAIEADANDALILLVLVIVSGTLVAASIIQRLRWSAAALRRSGAELAQAVQSLREEQAKQRELSELKTRFVAMTSHEFRTPLSVIMSSAEMLEAYSERWSRAKRSEHFDRIRSASLGMTRMLDAILMIGRSDAGALPCDPQPLDLGSFCADVVAAMAQANPDAQRIVYQAPLGPQPVCADRDLLRQVIENLLSNALKYSSNAQDVLCQVERDERELRLRVCDRGIGISREDQRHLFETFQRGKNVGNISGSGLGLAVVGRAVQLHGGSVAVRSQLGVGSEFTVRIPNLQAVHG
jgi:signal transduction histidine kinase